MTLREFKNILLTVTDKVYQDEANQEPHEYIVWSEVGDKSLRADDAEAEIAHRVNVRIFTDSPLSDLPYKLKKAFAKNDIAYEDFQTDYTPELRVRVYSTFCEVD